MKTLRIKTDINNPTDNYINVKLEQDFDNINILSMNLSQSDVYSTFSSDTGVVCGRINSFLVGIPNAKVSLFIPVSSVENRPDVLELYPFKNVTDTDNNDKRYNLLSRLKKLNPFTYIKENIYGIGYTPKTPVGSIPDKNELLVNNTWVEAYNDYYKFTTTTNDSGDYMFTNIPVGSYTLHVEFDITDIGKYSTPAPLLQKISNLNQGLYNEDGSKLLPNTDLNSMPNIFSRNIGVNVLPSWGDNTQQEIGITRQDVDFKVKLSPAFTVIGNGFTQDDDSFWGDRVILRVLFAISDLCFGFNKDYVGSTSLITLRYRTKFLGRKFEFGFGSDWKSDAPTSAFVFSVSIPDARPRFKFEILTFYRDRVNGGQFEMLPLDFKFLGFGTEFDGFLNSSAKEIGCCDSFPDCGANPDTITDRLNLNTFRTGKIFTKLFSYPETTNLTQPCTSTTDISYLDYLNSELTTINETKYYTFNEEKGSFIHIIPCNRRRVITNELGQEVETSDTTVGVCTEFSGSMLFEMEDLEIKSTGNRISTGRTRIKIPQSVNYDYKNEFNKELWKASYYTFNVNEVYTVAEFYNTLQTGQKDNFIQKSLNITNGKSNQTDSDYYARTGLFLPNMYDNNTLIGKDDEGDKIEQAFYFNQFNITNPNNHLSPIYNTIINIGVDGLKSDVINQEWVTGSLFFQQYAIKKRRNKKKTKYPSLLFSDYQVVLNNNDNIGANVTNSKGLLSGAAFPTTFIKLGIEKTVDNKTITQKDILIDLYENNNLALNLSGNSNIDSIVSSSNTNKFFIKGIDNESNMINNLIKKDII